MHAAHLSSITDRDLQQRLYGMCQAERRFIVELLLHLAEVERRKLFFEMGHTSLFDLLWKGLGYSKASAHRRQVGARLIAAFPQIGDYLRGGRLNLSQICALQPLLTADNVEQELNDAVGKPEDLLKAMVAGRLGKPVEVSSVRVLQVAPPLGLQPAPPLASPSSAGEPTALEPIAAVVDELHLVKAVVSRAFIDDLEAVRDALSHKFPDRDLAEVLHECLRITLAVVRKRKEGVGRPAAASSTPTPTKKDSRYVPTQVRRTVRERDGRRCAYVADDGQRCTSTHRLELHHVVPFAKGGASTADNLQVRCHVHNQLEARRELGSRRIVEAIARSRVSSSGPELPFSSRPASS